MRRATRICSVVGRRLHAGRSTMEGTGAVRHASTFHVHDPASGAVVGEAPDMNASDVSEAAAAAFAAWPDWRSRSPERRAGTLMKWYDTVQSRSMELAGIITAESGKPMSESRGEVAYAASFIQHFAKLVGFGGGRSIGGIGGDRRAVTVKQPVGPSSLLTPWNFPAAMITRKVAPALAAGCTAVVKPAAETPLTARLLLDMAHEAGVPKDALSMVTVGEGVQEVGHAMATDPNFRKMSFTGSTPVAKWLTERAAGTLKRVSIEAGGSAPFIVFDDADVEAAVDGFMASKYRNAGQTCVCANRIFVQRGTLERFREGVARATDELAARQGHGSGDGVQIGPLIRADRVEHMRSLLQGALHGGARIVSGNEEGTPQDALIEGPGPSGKDLNRDAFFRPTLLEVDSLEQGGELEACTSEVFGPLSVLQPFDTEEQVLEAANRAEVGLAGYFYSRDVGRVWRVAEALEVGIVGANTGIISSAHAPFGGVKESGFGREGGIEGLEEFLETKSMTFGGI